MTLLDVSRWISQLPEAVEEVPHDLALVGWLVPATDEVVRIVTGDLCLTVASADVLRVDDLLEQGGPSDEPPYQVVLRRGAALLDICPRQCVDRFMPSGRRPFALSSRPDSPTAEPAHRYRTLETAFLTEAGLVDQGP
jgi:hypothetical protein